MAFGSDRTVKVGLKLDVNNYVANIRSAGKATEDFGKRAVQHAEKNAATWQTVGTGMMVVGAAIGAGVGLAVKAYADFDKEMSKVRAVSGATAGEMTKLRDAAIDAGAKTAFSASEAAAATTELAKAGVSTADILGGALMGSLDLAAAGGLDLAFAAETAGQAMNLFKLQGKDVPRIADALANGANKSAADVSDLAQAMSQAGLVAAQTGLNLEDTVGVLSAFADRALRGSDAGTSLKTMLQRLNPQSEAAANLMDELGLRAYDAQGNFIGLEAYAQKLQDALSGMSTEQRNAAMQTLFGADAVRAANVLYDLGAKGVREYVSAIGEQGEAARVAAIQLDNLHGDLEELGGAFETVLIQGGEGANDALREMVQTLTGLVRAYGELPQPIQEGVVQVAALTAGVLLLGGAFISVVPKIAATKAALIQLTGSATAAKTAVATLGAAVATLGIAVAANEIAQWGGRARVATDSTKGLADALSDLDSAAAKNALDELISTSYRGEDAFERFGVAAARAFSQDVDSRINRWTDFGTSVSEFETQAAQLDKTMAQMVENGNIDGAAELYDRLMKSIDEMNASGEKIDADTIAAKFAEYQGALEASRGATADVTKMQGGLNAALAAGGQTAEEAREAMDKLIQSLAAAGLVQLDARSAARQLEQSIRDATEALKENGKTLDITTQKGHDNQAALDAIASAALNEAQAVYNATGSQEKYRQKLIESRPRLVAMAQAFGMGKAEAEKLADELLNFPAVKSVNFNTPGLDTAISKTGLLRQELGQLKDKTITVRTTYVGEHLAGPGRAVMKASGGYIAGPGTATSDSIPAWLSNGEYVVNAKATAQNRALLDAINSGRGVRAFASGGPVTRSATKAGQVIAVLADEDRARLDALAARPVSVQVDKREIARSANDYNSSRRS